MRITGLIARTHAAHDHDEDVSLEAPIDQLERRRVIAADIDVVLAELESPRRAIDAEDATLARASKRAKDGDVDGAIEALLVVYNDARKPLRLRGEAALRIAELAFAADKSDTTRAQIFFVRARLLWPQLDVRALELKLLVDQGRSKDALSIVQSLIADAPNDLELRALAVALLKATADRPGMLKAAQELLSRTVAQKKETTDALLLLADAFFENQKPEVAVDLYRKVIAESKNGPQLATAHHGIAEILPAPEFAGGKRETTTDRKGPHATEINELFDAANVAYKEGRYKDVRAFAEQILSSDPNDGLAHRMWAIAYGAEATAKRPLIPQLDTQEERQASIDALKARVNEARMPDGAGGTRPGCIADLFPEWDQLNEVQRAHAALSVLTYGKLIPLAMEGGAVYHIAGVGTSGAFLDPDSAPSDANKFGRHYYVIRGWYQGDTDFIVTGVERLDQGARSGSSVVAHEFAHLVHRLMTRALAKKAADRTPEERKLAAYAERITALYAAAAGKKADFFDAYSSNNEREFFAQAMQAYLGPTGGGSRRLFTAQRALWDLADEIRREYQTYAPNAVLPAHPAVGQAATASPMNLHALADDPSAPHTLRALARETFAHLEAMYAMGPVAVTNTERVPAPTAGLYTRGDDFVRLVREGRYDDAKAIALDIDADLRAGRLNEDELGALCAALTFGLDASARAGEYSFWQKVLQVLTFGLARLWQTTHEAPLHKTLRRLTKVARPPASALAAHPDLAGIDAAEVGRRRRVLMKRAEELLQMREGALPPGTFTQREEVVSVMGFSELAAQVEADAALMPPKDPRFAKLLALKRELTALLRGSHAEALETMRAAYLAI